MQIKKDTPLTNDELA